MHKVTDDKCGRALHDGARSGTFDAWVSIFSALARAAADDQAVSRAESDRLVYLGWAVVKRGDLMLTSDGRNVLRLLDGISQGAGTPNEVLRACNIASSRSANDGRWIEHARAQSPDVGCERVGDSSSRQLPNCINVNA